MAEDDLDFGDDDLELDDDSGDDFAGELDDMMGDDELGGDVGGGSDSDSELDSFFEDLSSIEDMDDGGGGDEGDDEDGDFSAPEEVDEKPAPVKKEKPPKEKSEGGGKMKIILPLILLILGGGSFGAYWFLLRTPEMVAPVPAPAVVMEAQPVQQPQLAAPAELPIKVEKQPVRRILPEPEIPMPAMPATPRRSYLIQVAKCSYDACKEEYINALRQDGEPVYQKSDGEKYDFIELVSRQVFGRERAQSVINNINRQNKMAGNASMKNQSNGYRVSMGTFPALDRAKEIKFHIEKMFPKKELSFNLEHVRKDYSATKVYAGPYQSRTEARSVLRELKKKPLYRGAFLVLTKDPI
jgi:hypothetical protein